MKEFYIHISSTITEEEIAFNRKHRIPIIRPGNALVTAQALEYYLKIPNINHNTKELLSDILKETNKTLSRTAIVNDVIASMLTRFPTYNDYVNYTDECDGLFD